jgi:hypothetical protein
MTTTIEEGRWYPDMPPTLDGEDDAAYTNRLTGCLGEDLVPYDHRRNRQCSIGWHRECSDQAGERCKCPHHIIENALTADGFEAPLPMPGSLWENSEASRSWLPAGHVHRLWIESVGKTVTGWQASARAWEIGTDGNPIDRYGEDGIGATLYLSKLLAEYRCLKEAK